MIGTIICDLDGVVYLGDQEIAGAGDALHRLDAMGYRLLFATNNSSRTRVEGAAKVTRITGYPTDTSQFVSSATAAGAMVAGTTGSAMVVGGPGVHEALTEVGISITDDPLSADVVLVGLDVDLTYDRLSRATRAVRNGARLVATNRDATFPTPTGQVPGAGAIVAAIETATGVRAEAAGKPFEPMRKLLVAMAAPGPIWMVGDRPDTDLAMAALEGWTSVLVLTGVVRSPIGVEPAPDLVLDSLAQLPDRI